MKLAFCLFRYFPYGGLQRDFLRIAKTCASRGHEVHVYTMQWEGEAAPDLHVHLINVHGAQNHTRSRRFAQRVQTAVAEASYDLVVGFNKMPGLDVYYAADVCYKARADAKHSTLYRYLPRYKDLVAFEQAVFAAGAPTEILLISPLQQAEFVRAYQTEITRFHVLPPGIARDRIAPTNASEIRTEKRLELAADENDLLILMVGSGFKTKGVDRAIQALAALPQALAARSRLLIIGQDRPEAFKQLAQKLGVLDRVNFLGGRPDVPAFLLAADLLLHPAYHENTGTVLLEAVVAGLPVLATDVCGYAHYIGEASAGCVLASPFDQAALNALLTHMLSDDAARKAWQAHGIAFAKTANIYQLADKAADIIEATAATHASSQPSFNDMMNLQGDVFRELEGRSTKRLQYQGKTCFIKQHRGIGWKEIIKNLLQGKWPVLGARQEYRALLQLQAIGISAPQVVAFGEQGKNPARQQSYIVMEALAPTISLEELVAVWKKAPPTFALKLALVKEVARIARTMHQAGMNHRDFYLCHFLLSIPQGLANIDPHHLTLSLIDLHRAQIRPRVPQRWMIKDLSGLYFSSKDSPLTLKDRLRFVKLYRNKSLRDIMEQEHDFWNKVITRGEKLYRDHC